MPIFYLKHLYKSYGFKYSPSFSLDLKNLTFNSARFIGIIGKSGSGKSTLLNLLSIMDKPDEGFLYFKGDPINFWKDKEIDYFHNQEMGIVFQHYNLLNNHSVLFNIMLPSLIGGDSIRKSKEKALKLLKEIDFKPELYKKRVADLSGGEKQRVSILRSLINDPSVIFADEPTGALDDANSQKIMQNFAEISKNRTVIMVSHNEELLSKYADEIIVISDGTVSKHYAKEGLKEKPIEIKKKKRKSFSLWPFSIVVNNFKNRLTRNSICVGALSFGLLAGLLIVGFINGSPASVDNYCANQFNYGQLKIYKEKKYEIDKSGISITRQSKPTDNELATYKNILEKYFIEPDLSLLVPTMPYISFEDNIFSNLVYDPIYDFAEPFINRNLLYKGQFPKSGSLNEIVVNTKCYEYLKKQMGRDPIGTSIRIQSTYENMIYNINDDETTLSDAFIYDKTSTIVGVIKEIDYLSANKIYYSYSCLEALLMEMPMENLSTKVGKTISWFSYALSSDSNDAISSYSYYAFLKDITKINEIQNDIESISALVLYSPSLTVQNSMKELMSAADIGLTIFMIIIFIGTALILGIVSFSSYCEDKKKCAILSALGANSSNIQSIYVLENMIIGLISIFLAFLFSNPFMNLINGIVTGTIGLENVINIPFSSFGGFHYLLPFIIIFSTIFICIFSTIIPITFSKKISLSEELKDE